MAALPPNPELKAHLAKGIKVKMNEGRYAVGILVGYDHFMNLTLRNVQIECPNCPTCNVSSCVIRGSSILSFEANNTN